MTITEQFKQYHGQPVSQYIIDDIKSHYFLTKHAQEQLEKRSDLLVKSGDVVNFQKTKENINNAIDKNVLAYFNTDGSINIALNEWNYFVFVYDEYRQNWTMVTYKESSWYGNTIFDKQKMALEGFDRQYK